MPLSREYLPALLLLPLAAVVLSISNDEYLDGRIVQSGGDAQIADFGYVVSLRSPQFFDALMNPHGKGIFIMHDEL